MDRKQIIATIERKLEGEINAKVLNVNLMIDNPVGVAEHIDYVETIEKELDAISELSDRLATLRKYFIIVR